MLTGAHCSDEIRDALTGPCPSICTPFTASGDIDWDGLRSQVDFVLDAGAKVVILTRGDSLYSLLTDDEIAEVTKFVASCVDRRALVVAADNQWWTGMEVEFAKYCVEVGADVLMVLPPDWAASTTQDTLVAHYSAVAQHLPVMLVTNYLGQRPPTFGLELIETLCDRVSGFVATKDDVCGEFARKMCLVAHEHVAIISGGLKQNHLNMLPYGVDGLFSTHISFKPEIAWRYWDAIQSGDLGSACAVIRDYDMPLFDYLFAMEGSFDAGMHGVLELFGIMTRHRRPPYHTLTDTQLADLREFLTGRWL